MWIGLASLAAKFLPALKSPKVAGSIAVVVGAVLLYLYVSHLNGKIEDLTEKKAQIAAFYDQCQKTNVENQNDIRTITGANKALAAAIRVSEEERVAAVKEAVERAARAESQLDDTLDDLEEMRSETPDCEALSRVDMGAACPAVTERLREHAAGTFDQD